MAQCLALGLPAKLGAAADALELMHRKDDAGERLMHQMSKPRRARKDEDPTGTYWFEDEERLQRLYAYSRQDVEVERELHNRLPPLPPTEQALWELTNKINARGFCVDLPFVHAQRKIAQADAPEINTQIVEVTSGAVTSIDQVAKLLQWLQARGYRAKSLERKAAEKQLDREDLPTPVRRALELRLGGAQSTVRKLSTLLASVGDDGRIRGSYRYHGAYTGRWSATLYQPQNLKRPTTEDLETLIAVVGTGDIEHVKAHYPRSLAAVGDCARSTIISAPDHKLVRADLSSIESRTLALLADETWKLDNYRLFDATKDAANEPYTVTAGKILGIPPSAVTKDQRRLGKICDLALGFGGGLKALRAFTDEFTDAEVEIFKNEWRAAHPKIKQFWYNLEHAATLAVKERGQTVRCGRLFLKCAGGFLKVRLPSGRKISYPQPRLIKDNRGKHRVVYTDNAAGRFTPCRGGLGCYGGLLVENATQAVARDLLAEAMVRAEAADYSLVLTTHDELVAEVPADFGSVEEFVHIITRKPVWAQDLPVSAEGWEGTRFK
jgi:DNA polymerase